LKFSNFSLICAPAPVAANWKNEKKKKKKRKNI